MSEEEGRLLEMLAMLIEEYEDRVDLSTNGRAAQDFGRPARRKRAEAQRPLVDYSKEPSV